MRHFFCEKAEKIVKNKVSEKTIAVGSVLVWMRKCEYKCIDCSNCGRLFCGSARRSIGKNDERKAGEGGEKSIFRRIHD